MSKKIIIGKPEFIPRVNPRLFWLSVAPIDKQLYIKWDKMRELMQAEGFSVDYGDLKMHITLARIKKRLPGYLEAHFLTTELKRCEVEIEQISLIRSYLTTSGVKYNKKYNYIFKKNK